MNVIFFYAFLNIHANSLQTNINIIHYHSFYQTLKEDFILIVCVCEISVFKAKIFVN